MCSVIVLDPFQQEDSERDPQSRLAPLGESWPTEGPSRPCLAAVEATLAGSFAPAEGEPDEPEHEENQGNEPKEMQSEAQASENEYDEDASCKSMRSPPEATQGVAL